jgi:hypothetical protein
MRNAKSEVFTAVKIQVDVFWFVTPCSVVVGYQRFGGPSWLHLQVVTPRRVVVGYQCIRGPSWLHLHPEGRGTRRQSPEVVDQTRTTYLSVFSAVWFALQLQISICNIWTLKTMNYAKYEMMCLENVCAPLLCVFPPFLNVVSHPYRSLRRSGPTSWRLPAVNCGNSL